MSTNPCCMPLKKGVTIMAVVDVVLSTLNLILLTVAVVKYSRDTDSKDDDDENVAIAAGVVVLLLGVLGLLLSLRLYQGATQGNAAYCRLWLIIKAIIFTLDLLIIVINASAGKTDDAQLGVNICVLVYRLYMMYCVKCFITQLRSEQTSLAFQGRMEEAGLAEITQAHNRTFLVQMQQFPQELGAASLQNQQQQNQGPNQHQNVVDGAGYTYQINQHSSPPRQDYF